MSREYAPAAIRALFDRIDELAPDLHVELSGILGDQAHTYGYHRARAVLPAGDYSVQLADDRKGDAWAASALDVKPANSAGMVTMTRRLIDATARRDPRLRPLREFFGTINGRSVTGRDVQTQRVVTADGSHTWHLHLSILRRYATDEDALAGIAAVIAGKPTEEEFTMDAEAKAAFAAVRKELGELRGEVDQVKAQLTTGVNVNGLENWSHSGDGSIETFLSGIPGYVPVAHRAKPAPAKPTKPAAGK